MSEIKIIGNKKYLQIYAQVGSLVITPNELKEFKKHGINLKKELKKIRLSAYNNLIKS